jgi:glycosyltransferase involved in cell wall biosynthesis
VRVLIATVQVPFVRGGAELLAAGLRDALIAAGHDADIAAVPFKWSPPERILDHMLACRLLDLSESMGASIDRIIGLKFPAYLAPHANKVQWIVHQHRQAYERWDHPHGDLLHQPAGVHVREAIRAADSQLIPQAAAVYAISGRVADRLQRFNGIAATPLYHPPPHAELFYNADARDYLFFPSRLGPDKRQRLVLEALAATRHPVRVRFAGAADHPAYARQLDELAQRLGVAARVEWLGHIGEAEKREQYAHARAVLFPPEDEDYGYVALEAMLAGKPVLTCSDSGGPLEFVRAEQTGCVAEPNPESVAAALDTLWHDAEQARAWGDAGRRRYAALGISWAQVVQRLLA